MKRKKPTVTVGIPAYNEEANISQIIADILRQAQKDFLIEEIIIVSDGSTDNTVKRVKKINNRKITLIDDKKRSGTYFVENQIIKLCKTEILVLLNADISLKNSFIYHLIKPIMENRADLTSGNFTPLPPKTFVERMLFISVLVKKEIYNNYKNGNNLYTCHGRSRAFSKSLYKNFRFENKLGDDALSFLYCQKNNGKYLFVQQAKGNYRLPNNWVDHERQSLRFFKSRTQYTKGKWEKLAKEHYYIPKIILVEKFFKYLAKYPIEIILYLISLNYIRIKALFTNNISAKWDISESSKILR